MGKVKKEACQHEDKYPLAVFLQADHAYLVIYCEDCDTHECVIGDACGSLDE